MSDKIDAVIDGETVEIGFNYRFLLDALRNSACERVAMEISGPLSPVKVLPLEGDEFLFLVLPVTVLFAFYPGVIGLSLVAP